MAYKLTAWALKLFKWKDFPLFNSHDCFIGLHMQMVSGLLPYNIQVYPEELFNLGKKPGFTFCGCYYTDMREGLKDLS